MRSCTEWVWPCNFQTPSYVTDLILTLDLNSATRKDFLARRPIQPHYLPTPAQDRTRICTFIPCQGSQQKDTSTGTPGRIEAPSPLVSKGKEEEEFSSSCGTHVLHSFEAHGIDSLIVELKIPEEGIGSWFLSNNVLGEAIYCCSYCKYSFLFLWFPILSKGKSPKLLKQWPSHLPVLMQLLQEHFTSKAVSKHSLAEINLPNF